MRRLLSLLRLPLNFTRGRGAPGLLLLSCAVLAAGPINVKTSMAQERPAKEKEDTKPPSSKEEEKEKEKGEPNTPEPPVEEHEDARSKETSVSAETSGQEACLVTPSKRGDVVKRLKKMRPKPAAKLLAALPPELAADLLLRIDARQSARIMNELPPQTGAALVALLSQHDATPAPPSQSAPTTPLTK